MVFVLFFANSKFGFLDSQVLGSHKMVVKPNESAPSGTNAGLRIGYECRLCILSNLGS